MATRIIMFTFLLTGQSRCSFCIFKAVLVSRKFHARNRVFCPAAPKAVFLVSQSGSFLTVPLQGILLGFPSHQSLLGLAVSPWFFKKGGRDEGTGLKGDTREQSFIQACMPYMMLNKWAWLSLVSYESQKWSLAETGGKSSLVQAALMRVRKLLFSNRHKYLKRDALKILSSFWLDYWESLNEMDILNLKLQHSQKPRLNCVVSHLVKIQKWTLNKHSDFLSNPTRKRKRFEEHHVWGICISGSRGVNKRILKG